MSQKQYETLGSSSEVSKSSATRICGHDELKTKHKNPTKKIRSYQFTNHGANDTHIEVHGTVLQKTQFFMVRTRGEHKIRLLFPNLYWQSLEPYITS
jgi:hypothetical protein